jgi:hypothetical protein
MTSRPVRRTELTTVSRSNGTMPQVDHLDLPAVALVASSSATIVARRTIGPHVT